MSPEQNELEDNLNELLSTVTNEDDAENLRPYKIIKPDPGMFLSFFTLCRNRLSFCFMLFC